jgi:hypothetical protein
VPVVPKKKGRTIDRADEVGEPESGSKCDDDLVMSPECGAESARLRGGIIIKAKLTCAE